MVKEHLDGKRGNPLPPLNGLLFPIRFFCMHHPTYRIAHTTAFAIPVVEYWLYNGGNLLNLVIDFNKKKEEEEEEEKEEERKKERKKERKRERKKENTQKKKRKTTIALYRGWSQ